MAIALAYWSAEFQAFNLYSCDYKFDLSELLETLAPIGREHIFSPGIIVDRMNEISQELRIRKSECIPDEIDFDRLRRLCLNAFINHNDFTLLHTVTGCHALSVVLPFIANKREALTSFWQAILVAYLSTGLEYSSIQEPRNIEVNFAPIIDAALTSLDSHVIKLVYTCWQEYEKHKEPCYFIAAQRAISTRA